MTNMHGNPKHGVSSIEDSDPNTSSRSCTNEALSPADSNVITRPAPQAHPPGADDYTAHRPLNPNHSSNIRSNSSNCTEEASYELTRQDSDNEQQHLLPTAATSALLNPKKEPTKSNDSPNNCDLGGSDSANRYKPLMGHFHTNTTTTIGEKGALHDNGMDDPNDRKQIATFLDRDEQTNDKALGSTEQQLPDYPTYHSHTLDYSHDSLLEHDIEITKNMNLRHRFNNSHQSSFTPSWQPRPNDDDIYEDDEADHHTSATSPMRGRSFTSPEPSKVGTSLFKSTFRRWMGSSSSASTSESGYNTLNTQEEDIWKKNGDDNDQFHHCNNDVEQPNGTTNSPGEMDYFDTYSRHSHQDTTLHHPPTQSRLRLDATASIEEEEDDTQNVRQRAFSEPDRSRAWFGFSSIRQTNQNHNNISNNSQNQRENHLSTRHGHWRKPNKDSKSKTRPKSSSSNPEYYELGKEDDPSSICNTTNQIEQDIEESRPETTTLTTTMTTTITSLTPLHNASGEDEEPPPQHPTSGNEMEHESSSTTTSSSTTRRESATALTDPNREARRNWIIINQRFQLLLVLVAFIFSLLLFFILVCWVVLTSAYVSSIEKKCDVPLKIYFWLATLQLILDVFRKDIMRALFRWNPNATNEIPHRVIIFNITYLAYAMIVLRMGIVSVFGEETKCGDTAPELFFTSRVFVSLSLAAWITIILGYLIPFCIVAFLLTRNGYSPSSDINGIENRFGVFPVAYTGDSAPEGCIDMLQTVLFEEFPAHYPKECCICMLEFSVDDTIVKTECDHVFHKRCCETWLRQARTCPVCRDDIPSALNMEEDDNSSNERAQLDGIARMNPSIGLTDLPFRSREFRNDVSTLVGMLGENRNGGE